MPGSELSPLHSFYPHLILPTYECYSYTHFVDEETESRRG